MLYLIYNFITGVLMCHFTVVVSYLGCLQYCISTSHVLSVKSVSVKSLVSKAVKQIYLQKSAIFPSEL